MKMPSVMSHSFSIAPQADIPRSSFDRSHGCKTTFNSDFLVPVFVDEALPGDTFNCKMTAFARMATPKFPLMDNLYMDSFFFAVPYRLVWENWERFNGARDDPTSSTEFILPTLTMPAGGATEASLSDYFGIPTGVAGLRVQSLYHRAYNLIWNEWFRDENLQNSIAVPTGDGPDTYSSFKLLKRGKRHDYFTSCLPWPQKGPAVTIPLIGEAPVTGIGKRTQSFSGNTINVFETGGSASVPYQLSRVINPSNSDEAFYVEGDSNNPGFPNIRADLSAVAGVTIDALRRSFQIQKMYERDARGGTRYTEIIRSHFSVTSPDSRLQRPEYLGGGSSPVNVQPVVQTSSTDPATSPQGNLAAFATTSLVNHGFVKSFTEHCLIVGMVSVRADLTYQQGLNRLFSRSTRFDFYWPALSHLGEQSVLNKEIFADGSANDEKVFGYQERYAEYRYKPSIVTGAFRSSATASLDAWHLSQDFANLPTLSPAFIQESVPMDRVLAVPSSPDFLFDSYISLKCARPMPVYSVPGLVDHF